jgi:membrane-associated phospholipid phosphatase
MASRGIIPKFYYGRKIHTANYEKIIYLIIFFFILCTYVYGQEKIDETENGIVPLSIVFHNIGRNALHSITHNYGLNFIGAGLGTWALIESSLDWKWNRLAYNNEWMPKTGVGANFIGYVIPVLTPVTLYLTGFSTRNEKLQITGLALAQSLALTFLTQTSLKIITGRTWPGLADGWDSSASRRIDRSEDYSGEFNWFTFNVMGGWPSGHAANAFSAASTLAQIYHDNKLLKAAVFTYASLLSLCMSVYDHWASDIFAGVIIGIAIGTTVGKSYRNLFYGKENKLTFYVTSNSLGVMIRSR